DRHRLAVDDAAEAEERAAREAAARARAEEERARAEAEERARAEAERAAREAEERAEREAVLAEERAEELAEAADRLDVVRRGLLDAIGDAVDFDEPALAEELRAALARADEALAAGEAGPASAAVAAVEELLPRAEARLDDLLLAHERRAALARALQEAMAGHGFTFTGGGEVPGQLLLRFERMNGAVYETAIRVDESGQAALSYAIDGEPGIPDGPNPVATCSTEELLDGVHAELATEDFLPGELDWDGKPPRGGGRSLPGQGRAR
ncbi:hypothetical protein EBN88_25920, partial [Streptomyces triticirhizae]